MKYEHDIRAIRRVDGNVSYWIAKSQQLPGCLGRGSSVEEAIQNLIDPKGNTNGAKGLSDDTLRSLRIEDESDSEKHQGLERLLRRLQKLWRAERLQQRRRILCSVGTRTGRCGHSRRKGVTKAKEGHNRECKKAIHPAAALFLHFLSKTVGKRGSLVEKLFAKWYNPIHKAVKQSCGRRILQ